MCGGVGAGCGGWLGVRDGLVKSGRSFERLFGGKGKRPIDGSIDAYGIGWRMEASADVEIAAWRLATHTYVPRQQQQQEKAQAAASGSSFSSDGDDDGRRHLRRLVGPPGRRIGLNG